MQSINALSLAPDASIWLANSRHPRILHIFDHACNLINERREVLSIVTPQIGSGPFNLVIENEICFSEHINLQSLISNSLNRLNLGELIINTANAKLWSPRPNWEMLHARRDDILNQLMSLPTTNYQVYGLDIPFAESAQGYSATTNFQSLVSNLSSALVNADIPSALTLTSQLAGLGAGLTPAGDDFILGAVLAVWVIHPPEIASVLAKEITNIAAPLTTSLSAAWLKSAGKGEAGIFWHSFFNALISANPVQIQEAMDDLLAVGATSGADALAGLTGTFVCWAELLSSKIP